MPQPLEGVRIVELAGIGPGPYAGQLLADMGAEVIVVDRPRPSPVELHHAVERRGKRSVRLNLRQEAGVAALLD
ncbi:MAG: CoA transferase, partial [Pseudomonadota bacterium]